MASAEVQPTEPALPFWSIFEHSRIPMAVLDDQRRYLKVNDALVDFYEYPRAQLIGSRADSMVVADQDGIDARWEQLVEAGQLYGERIVEHSGGTHLRVTYAAHSVTVGDTWLVLIVTLSARLPDCAELIGKTQVESAGPNGSKLTAREREVVRLVALGSNTRRIADELSLSPDTVRSHVRNAMGKSGAHTRAHLVALVLSDGLALDAQNGELDADATT